MPLFVNPGPAPLGSHTSFNVDLEAGDGSQSATNVFLVVLGVGVVIRFAIFIS